MFSSSLLVASIFLIFIMPAAGIPLFLLSWFMIASESKAERKEEDIENLTKYYEEKK